MCTHSEKARVTQCLWRGRECNGDRETDWGVFPPSPSVLVCTGLPHILQDPNQRISLNLEFSPALGLGRWLGVEYFDK